MQQNDFLIMIFFKAFKTAKNIEFSQDDTDDQTQRKSFCKKGKILQKTLHELVIQYLIPSVLPFPKAQTKT